MHRGYIKIWRKLEDSGLLQMHGTLALFMYMLLKATHKPTRSGMTELERGQLISGRHKLSEAVGLSDQQLRTCEKNLIKLGMIEAKATNKFTLYTIVNYGIYQDSDDVVNKQLTNEQQATNNQSTTIQEHKHINTKEDKALLSEYSDEFEQFWKLYPKKTGKGGAYQSWKKQKPKIDLVLQALSWQTKSEDWTKQNGQFCPMPTTYLNQRRWEDESPVKQPSQFNIDDFMRKVNGQ